MKWISRLLVVVGLTLLGAFGYSLYDHTQSTSATLEEAEQVLEKSRTEYVQASPIEEEPSDGGDSETVEAEEKQVDARAFDASNGEVFGILTIPKLNRSIGIMEGADTDTLKNGVGHVSSTVYPGQNEQIVLSGHRDTVFRDFGELGIGDTFIVEMPYGDFEYVIQSHEIVNQYDTSVIRNMGEEVLVVSTCYPFNYFGYAPDRFVFYAYPV